MPIPSKRKMPPMGLQRRVRPRREDKWEPEPEVGDDGSSEEDSDAPLEEEAGRQQSADESGSEDSEDQPDSEEDTPAPKTDLSSISFGALARAQASLPSTKRSKKHTQDEDEDSEPDSHPAREPSKKRPSKADMKRTSKHKPQEQTSKKPVSRRREFLDLETKRAPARDPRFDPAIGGPSTPQDQARARAAYAFLEKYRDDELAELKAQVKKTKDPSQKEDLKRQILSMESRRKADKKKAEQEALLREHRSKEKELVAQGKQPFYLKRAEQKKQLLTKRFEGMSKGQRDRTIERKRKKVAGREKKELDMLESRRPR